MVSPCKSFWHHHGLLQNYWALQMISWEDRISLGLLGWLKSTKMKSASSLPWTSLWLQNSTYPIRQSGDDCPTTTICIPFGHILQEIVLPHCWGQNIAILGRNNGILSVECFLVSQTCWHKWAITNNPALYPLSVVYHPLPGPQSIEEHRNNPDEGMKQLLREH